MPWPELKDFLQEREQQSLSRSRDSWEATNSGLLYKEGKAFKVFCSNDYLGLAAHPDITSTLQSACQQWGLGSTASHLVNGHCHEHHQLENELADFLGRERALLFSTGYMANLGTLSALMGKDDAIFQDKLNHASLLDGGLLSGAQSARYLHCDTNSLRLRLEKSKAKRKLIVSDGVFSMDGDIAPLNEIIALAEEFDARLMIDDAHGIGAIGTHGRGVIDVFGLGQQQLPIIVGTLGKAFGGFGAFVAGSNNLIETLIQRARPYIYTTALPPALAAAMRKSLSLVKSEGWRREQLTKLIKHFQKSCQKSGLTVMPSNTPIQPILMGDSNNAMSAEQHLRQAGILLKAIRPPTVAQGRARLRVTLSATHSLADIDFLVQQLNSMAQDMAQETGLFKTSKKDA